MASDLGKFGLADMLRCSLAIREIARDEPTMESAARRICRYLREELVDGAGGPACALVRCYKTHPFGLLEPGLQRFVRAQMGPLSGRGPRIDPSMRCLTLLATAGDDAAWNRRQASRGHQAIPLASAEMVERAPMIAQLVRQFGLEIADVVSPGLDSTGIAAGRKYGVFHVEEAAGSPYIPAQEFVTNTGVRSVIGFGGALGSDALFAIVLFARVPVSAASADRFRTFALDVKSSFVTYSDSQVFDGQRFSSGGSSEEGVGVPLQ